MTAWTRLLRGAGLRQPDSLSCGACVAEVAGGVVTGSPAPSAPGFATAVLVRHRQLTSTRDAAGHWQVPWPRWWGTPTWALARHLRVVTGREHRVAWARVGRRSASLVDAGLASGSPVPLYVGGRLLPRHVVLALPDPLLVGVDATSPGGWTVYDPASGRLRRVDPAQWRRGRLNRGWSTPWFAVVPRHDPTARVTPVRR